MTPFQGRKRLNDWPLARDFDSVGKEFYRSVPCDIHVTVLAFGSIQPSKRKWLKVQNKSVSYRHKAILDGLFGIFTFDLPLVEQGF